MVYDWVYGCGTASIDSTACSVVDRDDNVTFHSSYSIWLSPRCASGISRLAPRDRWANFVRVEINLE